MSGWLPEAPVRERCRQAWAFHQDGATPDARTSIFVFGSNLAGRHGKGSAKVARYLYGARYGMPRGQFNRSYALPTKDEDLKDLPLSVIRQEVAEFMEHAVHMDQELFVVTRIGCGLAGYQDAQIAPMFRQAPANCSFAEEWRRYLVAGAPWEVARTKGMRDEKSTQLPGVRLPEHDRDGVRPAAGREDMPELQGGLREGRGRHAVDRREGGGAGEGGCQCGAGSATRGSALR